MTKDSEPNGSKHSLNVDVTHINLDARIQREISKFLNII
jgi:hypothetical protein